MKKSEFDALVEELGAEPQLVLDRLTVDRDLTAQEQEWMDEVQEAWEEACRQERDYARYCAAHRY